MITSILMANGMAIGVLVEALLPGGTAGGTVHKPLLEDEKGCERMNQEQP